MSVRTDLAIESGEHLSGNLCGVEKNERINGDIKITEINITSREGEKELNRKMGKYITLQFPDIYKITDYSDLQEELINSLKILLPEKNEILLVAGLGNTEITPDKIGPETANQILATRHIVGQFAENMGLKGLKSVSVITPKVLGQTGIETLELIRGAVNTVKPDILIVIDALASKSTDRLFKTVQLCNTGISPGSGVKNARSEISQESLNLPVIAIGVPTVVDADTLATELTGVETEKQSDMLVTPKEVDLLVDRICEILAYSINVFLQPEIDKEVLKELI